MRTDYSELIEEYFRNVERLETDPEYREKIRRKGRVISRMVNKDLFSNFN